MLIRSLVGLGVHPFAAGSDSTSSTEHMEDILGHSSQHLPPIHATSTKGSGGVASTFPAMPLCQEGQMLLQLFSTFLLKDATRAKPGSHLFPCLHF